MTAAAVSKKDVNFGGVVAEEGALRDASFGSDLVHRHVVIARFGEESKGNIASVSDALEQAVYTRPPAEMSPPAFGVSVLTSEDRLGDHAADRMLVMGGGGPFSVYWAIQDLRALEVGDGQAGVATVDSLAERWAAFGALGG